MKKRGSCLFACFTLFIITLVNSVSAQTTDSNYSGLIERAINNLLQMQEADGAWPYEGVYRVGGEIPVGYRVGGTAIVCDSLLSVPKKNTKAVDEAIRRGIQLMLDELKDPRMDAEYQECIRRASVGPYLCARSFLSIARIPAIRRLAGKNGSLDRKADRNLD